MVTAPAELLSGKTAWARRVQSTLREHLERRRGGSARLGGGGARVGERGRLFVPGPLGDRARDRPRRRGSRADAARLGQQWAYDVLLLRAGSRGAARVRPRARAA